MNHETVEGELTGIEKWYGGNAIEVNRMKINIADFILDNLPPDVRADVTYKLNGEMVHPGYKILIFLDLKVRVVRS